MPKAKQPKLDNLQLLSAQWEKRFRRLSDAIGALDIQLANVRSVLTWLKDVDTELQKDIEGIEQNMDDFGSDLEAVARRIGLNVEAPEEIAHDTLLMKRNEENGSLTLGDDEEVTPAPATITAVPGGKQFVRINDELHEANGLLCEVCNEPQAEVDGLEVDGATCINGHTGAPGWEPSSTNTNGVS